MYWFFPTLSITSSTSLCGQSLFNFSTRNGEVDISGAPCSFGVDKKILGQAKTKLVRLNSQPECHHKSASGNIIMNHEIDPRFMSLVHNKIS